MTNQKNVQLELHLKSLADILKRLSLPELFIAQDLLRGVIRDRSELDKAARETTVAPNPKQSRRRSESEGTGDVVQQGD